jgi:hypothetical protein
MTAESSCPLCGKSVDDILKHFVMVHDIENLEHLKREIAQSESVRRRQREFLEFISDLNEKRRKNLISAEQYRELVSRWRAENQ